MAIQNRPVFAITIGDPAGIGPEVVVKALSRKEIYDACIPLVVGERKALLAALASTKSLLKIRTVTESLDACGDFGTIDLLDMHNLDAGGVKPGRVSADCGRASMEFIDKAMHLALEKQVTGIVTAPINKEATMLAGYPGLGHLEYIAKATGSKEYATMLATGNLRCVHLSTHLSVRDACDYVKQARVLGRLKLTHESFRNWGFDTPVIGVAALNPHAGEEGMFGSEEIEEIIPAVREAVSLGIDARGPYPADSIFNRAIAGEFDAVIAMYHDQGHIPVKVHGFEKSVSVALGLPILRTAVDHGTAFDIAEKNIASAESMVEAIMTAVRLSQGKGLG